MGGTAAPPFFRPLGAVRESMVWWQVAAGDVTRCATSAHSHPHNCFLTMSEKSQQQKNREAIVSALNMTIEAANLASFATPTAVPFVTLVALLTIIRVCFLFFWNKRLMCTQDLTTDEEVQIGLELLCNGIRRALEGGMKGTIPPLELDRFMRGAQRRILNLAEIQEKRRKYSGVSQLFGARDNKEIKSKL